MVNFGLVSGREATLAEVDRLGRRVCKVAGDVRVHAVRVHDMGPGSESIVNQVVVYAGSPDVRRGDHSLDLRGLGDRLRERTNDRTTGHVDPRETVTELRSD